MLLKNVDIKKLRDFFNDIASFNVFSGRKKDSGWKEELNYIVAKYYVRNFELYCITM